jgi:hypothetical protein
VQFQQRLVHTNHTNEPKKARVAVRVRRCTIKYWYGASANSYKFLILALNQTLAEFHSRQRKVKENQLLSQKPFLLKPPPSRHGIFGYEVSNHQYINGQTEIIFSGKILGISSGTQLKRIPNRDIQKEESCQNVPK